MQDAVRDDNEGWCGRGALHDGGGDNIGARDPRLARGIEEVRVRTGFSQVPRERVELLLNAGLEDAFADLHAVMVEHGRDDMAWAIEQK